MMTIKPIKTEKDYQDCLKRLDVILDAKKGTFEGDELQTVKTSH
jgi:HTH-type transcriptional regulator/antitoxin HigA